MKDQFPTLSEQGHKIIPHYAHFKFSSDVPNKLCIGVAYDAQDGYTLAFEPAAATVNIVNVFSMTSII